MRNDGSDGIGRLPFFSWLISWLSGKSCARSLALMRKVGKRSRRALRELSSIFSGCSCKSIHRSTPIAITRCTSPGRGPKVRRLRACRARFCSLVPEAGLSGYFFLASRGETAGRLRERRRTAYLDRRSMGTKAPDRGKTTALLLSTQKKYKSFRPVVTKGDCQMFVLSCG